MTDPDPAAVEAVAEAICDNEDGCGLWGVYWEEIEEGDRDNFRSYARHAIAALSALGWVDGSTKAKLVQRVNNLERGLDTVTAKLAEAEKYAEDQATQLGNIADTYKAERDALRAALELIAAPVRADGTYNRCREACEVVARDAITAAKGTP